MKKTLLLCGITGAMVSSPIYASINDFYVGGQIGYGRNNSTPSGLNALSVPVTVNNIQYNAHGPTKVSVDDEGIAGRVFAGYQFNKHLSLEGGYTQYSTIEIKNVYGVKGNEQPLFEGAFDGVMKGSLSLTDRFRLYAKAGVAFVMTQNLAANGVTSITQLSSNAELNYSTQNINEFRPTYGVGANFDFTKRLSADLSWSQIIAGNRIPTTNFAGVGLVVHV